MDRSGNLGLEMIESRTFGCFVSIDDKGTQLECGVSDEHSGLWTQRHASVSNGSNLSLLFYFWFF